MSNLFQITKDDGQTDNSIIRFQTIEENTVKVFQEENGKEREVVEMYVLNQDAIDFFENAIEDNSNAISFNNQNIAKQSVIF